MSKYGCPVLMVYPRNLLLNSVGGKTSACSFCHLKNLKQIPLYSHFHVAISQVTISREGEAICLIGKSQRFKESPKQRGPQGHQMECRTFSCYVKQATCPAKRGKRGFGRLSQTVIQSSTPTQNPSEGVSISPGQARTQAGTHSSPRKMAKLRHANTPSCADWK